MGGVQRFLGIIIHVNLAERRQEFLHIGPGVHVRPGALHVRPGALQAMMGPKVFFLEEALFHAWFSGSFPSVLGGNEVGFPRDLIL